MNCMQRRTFLGSRADVALPAWVKAEPAPLAKHRVATARHATAYWQTGPAHGPLMIFVHGWPELGLLWRGQIQHFAAAGWRRIAPDMRGYGDSSAPRETNAYALQEIVTDMLELHDALGGAPAVWVGHDWGSPTIAALAAHRPQRSRGAVLTSVPYFPNAFALSNLTPLVDRTLYPVEQFPDGQRDYFHFYQTHFEQAAKDYEADIRATVASIFKRGSPTGVGKPSPTASVTANGGPLWRRASRACDAERLIHPLAGRRRCLGGRLRQDRLSPRRRKEKQAQAL